MHGVVMLELKLKESSSDLEAGTQNFTDFVHHILITTKLDLLFVKWPLGIWPPTFCFVHTKGSLYFTMRSSVVEVTSWYSSTVYFDFKLSEYDYLRNQLTPMSSQD